MRDREDEREWEKSVRPSISGCLTVEVKWLDSEEKKQRPKWEPVLEGKKGPEIRKDSVSLPEAK